MEKIENLTAEQEQKLEKYYEKWLEIGMKVGTTKEDRKETEKNIFLIYKNQGLKKPKILWTRSPHEAAMLAIEKGDVSNDIVWAAGYGNHDANWLGFYDFMRTELGLVEETEELVPLMENAKHGGWWFPYEKVCICSDRAEEIHVNSDGSLHCETGPAIRYGDGFSMFMLNGIEVEEKIALLKPDDITKDDILKQPNVDIRREIAKKLTPEKLAKLLDAKILDEKYGYRLLGIDIGDNRTRPFLEMGNPSIKATHIEGVKPDIKNVEEAICFRNQLKEFNLPKTLDGKDLFKKFKKFVGAYHQQGDALFFPIDSIPSDAKKRKDNVAVDGLQRHLAHGKGVTVYEGFLSSKNEIRIKHPEHGDTVLKGTFQMKQVLEYDHWLEESRRVVD